LTVDDRPDQQDNRTIARRLVMELAQGCGDHSCRFKKPSGMGTNGGCRCIDKIEDALSRRSTVTPEAHKRVYEYDGAFKCLDCRAKWGALPGKPTMPPTCPAPSPVIEKARECIECGAEIDTGAVCGACANVQRREDLGL
jgi:hypothetical protein